MTRREATNDQTKAGPADNFIPHAIGPYRGRSGRQGQFYGRCLVRHCIAPAADCFRCCTERPPYPERDRGESLFFSECTIQRNGEDR